MTKWRVLNLSETAINTQDNGCNERNTIQKLSDCGLFSNFSDIDETYFLKIGCNL